MVFSEKFGGFHILQIKKTPKRRPFHPFPVDKVKHVQQLKGNEYETRNNEHPVLHSEDKTGKYKVTRPTIILLIDPSKKYEI